MQLSDFGDATADFGGIYLTRLGEGLCPLSIGFFFFFARDEERK
jgi:hypothetical protein